MYEILVARLHPALSIHNNGGTALFVERIFCFSAQRQHLGKKKRITWAALQALMFSHTCCIC